MKPVTPNNIIVLNTTGGASSISTAIHKQISKIFGGKDSDYFTHSEQIVELLHKKENKIHKFKVVLVEDANEAKHQLWFDITNCS